MSNDSQIVKTAGTAIEREGFSGREIEARHETSTTAMATQARAEIEARYVMALQRPRNDENVRVRLLRECKRLIFAERAFYSIPRGDKSGRLTGTENRIEGLSIRFAEACVRLSGNIVTGTRVAYDDDFKRQITITVTDLETNAIYTADALIAKTIERRKPKDGTVILGKRMNSAGDEVFIVQTTDEELLQKQANVVARISRTLELKLVPADTLDECEREIVATLKSGVSKDPDAEKKKIADAFASLNVMPADLRVHLGHDLGTCSPAELLDLRGLFAAIRDGEITWAEVVAEKAPKVDADGVVTETKTTGKTVADRIKERVEKQEAKKAGAPPAAATLAGATTPAPPPVVEKDPLTGEIVPPAKEEAPAALKLSSPEAAPDGKSRRTKRDREPGED